MLCAIHFVVAIAQREYHKDYVSRDLFDAILKSEEEHVDFLETQLDLIEKVGLQNHQQSQTQVPAENHDEKTRAKRVLRYGSPKRR